MLTQFLEIFKTETGKRVLEWALSSGIGLIVLSLWVFSLSQKQDKLEVKMDNQNQEIKVMLRYQTDTLNRTLERNNRILEKFEIKSRR
jgi:plastocyanin domain-containing protein